MSAHISSSSYASIIDSSKVRLGAFAPVLSTADTSKVRLGAFAPVLNTADTGALRFRLDATGARLISARRLDRPRYWREAAAVVASGYAIGHGKSER